MYSNNDHTWVVLAYKESSYLEDCISSLMRQTLKSNIVITTSTLNNHIESIAKKYELPICISPNKPGIASDWNFALQTGKNIKSLVTLAHQDDVYSDVYTESMLALINQASKPLIYFTNYGELRNNAYIDSNSVLKVKRILLRPIKKSKIENNTNNKRALLKYGSPICCPSVTYCVSNLDLPLFDNKYKCNLDWECWEKLSKLDGEFLYESDILIHHRIHKESETTTCIENNVRELEDLQMFQKFWPKKVAQIINKLYGLSRNNNSI